MFLYIVKNLFWTDKGGQKALLYLIIRLDKRLKWWYRLWPNSIFVYFSASTFMAFDLYLTYSRSAENVLFWCFLVFIIIKNICQNCTSFLRIRNPDFFLTFLKGFSESQIEMNGYLNLLSRRFDLMNVGSFNIKDFLWYKLKVKKTFFMSIDRCIHIYIWIMIALFLQIIQYI